MTLDEDSRAILDILRDDARLSNREVARRLDIPESRVRARIRRMQDEGLMRFSLIVQPAVAGLRVSAFVHFSVEAAHLREAARYLTEQENVVYVSIADGDYNLHTVVLARSHSHLYSIINGPWRDAYGVTRTQVRIFFKAPKHRYDLMRLPD